MSFAMNFDPQLLDISKINIQNISYMDKSMPTPAGTAEPTLVYWWIQEQYPQGDYLNKRAMMDAFLSNFVLLYDSEEGKRHDYMSVPVKVTYTKK